MTNLDSILKSRDITLPIKVHLVKPMVFLLVMYRCESWPIKKAEHWRIDVFEQWVGEDSWDCKEIKPVNLEGNQSWIFTGRNDAEAEAPILWLSDVKSWLTGEDPDAGKDWRWEEKETTEDEIFGWHHRLNGREFEQAPGDGEGQWILACWSPWGRKDLDTIERLNNNRKFREQTRSTVNDTKRVQSANPNEYRTNNQCLQHMRSG